MKLGKYYHYHNLIHKDSYIVKYVKLGEDDYTHQFKIIKNLSSSISIDMLIYNIKKNPDNLIEIPDELAHFYE